MVARLDLVGENLQLLAQDRRLDRIETRGKPDADIVVAIAALPVHAQAAQHLGHVGVVGHHRAAVAVAAERLCREEAGGSKVAEGAEPAVVIDCAKPLRGVVEDEQAFRLGGCRHSGVIGGKPEQIDRNDRLGLEAEAFSRGNGAGDAFGVDIE